MQGYGRLAVWHIKKICHNLFNQWLKNLLPFRIARELADVKPWLETAGKTSYPVRKTIHAIDSFHVCAFYLGWRFCAITRCGPQESPLSWPRKASSRYSYVSGENNYSPITKAAPGCSLSAAESAPDCIPFYCHYRHFS